jgi:hypothetical protein
MPNAAAKTVPRSVMLLLMTVLQTLVSNSNVRSDEVDGGGLLVDGVRELHTARLAEAQGPGDLLN